MLARGKVNQAVNADAVGVLSHETALSLLGLSDVLPARIHITVPLDWRHRRLRVPHGVVIHHADVPADERTWVGAVPMTSARRTLIDCAHEGLSPDLLRQAARQATARGLVSKAKLARVEEALEPFGGIDG